ncbi:unnamed protein product [Effrenium voratum]|nr:unnamed protein product [Effrenium voratum]
MTAAHSNWFITCDAMRVTESSTVSVALAPVLQERQPFTCKDGLPLDYDAVTEETWRQFDTSLSHLASKAAYLRGIMKALSGGMPGEVPRLPSKFLPMPVCKEMDREDKTKIETGKRIRSPQLRENKVVPGPRARKDEEIEIAMRVRKPFGEVGLNSMPKLFRQRATIW